MAASRKLYIEDVAALAGLARQTIETYRARSAARFPVADGVAVERGHARPWWREATVRNWLANRPGSGNWAASRHARDKRS